MSEITARSVSEPLANFRRCLQLILQRFREGVGAVPERQITCICPPPVGEQEQAKPLRLGNAGRENLAAEA